ncbi:hypothetical protein BH11MYX1_BH11MYX1_37800 [soil metagenome]
MDLPKLDLPKLEKLAENPWALVAFGALAGVWLASLGEGSKANQERSLVAGLLGGLVLKTVRDVALSQMGKIAHTWLAEQPPESPPPSPFAS